MQQKYFFASNLSFSGHSYIHIGSLFSNDWIVNEKFCV